MRSVDLCIYVMKQPRRTSDGLFAVVGNPRPERTVSFDDVSPLLASFAFGDVRGEPV